VRFVLQDEADSPFVEYVQGMKNVALRLWPLAQKYWFDVLIVAAAIGAAVELVINAGSENVPKGSLWLIVPAIMLITLPLLARRQFPFGAVAFIFLYATAISFANGRIVVYSAFTFLTVLVCAFLLGMLDDRRQSLVGLAIAIGAATVVGSHDPQNQSLGDYFWIPVFFGIFWLAGFGLGGKVRQATQAEERAAQLEREREERARLAVAEERTRIARELHDIVGHSVSVMTVQASAVRRLLLPEQEREREALEIVEQTGREALAEMRRLVGVLRRPEEAPALAPQPSLEHLDKLVEQVREAGLPVELRVEGKVTPLSPGVDLTGYRLVQEGLTNAVKHAGAQGAHVLVRYGSEEVEIVVSDDGDGTGDGEGSGHGLVGMRERVAVYGGKLEAGPRPEGGFALRARLPLVNGHD
jgi:signal transduction histidine kinase